MMITHSQVLSLAVARQRAGRLALVVFLAASSGVSLPAAETSDLPAAFPAERYASMKSSSPFALATVEVAKEEPSFARDLYLTGRANIGGRDMISITNRDKTKSFTLISGEPPVEGMSLLEVRPDPIVGKTTAIIKKGNETAPLQFNEMDIRPPVTAMAMPNQPVPRTSTGTNVLPAIRVRVNPSPDGKNPSGPRPPRRIIRRPSN